MTSESPANPTAPAPPPALAAQAAQLLDHISGSRAFKGSARHRTLLRHLVGHLLNNELTSLKESVIAIQVFGRSPSEFDPRLDSIVRVETRRLRVRLARYFRSEGREAALRIELPVGSYVPRILSRAEPEFGAESSRRARDLVERGNHFLRQRLSQEVLEQALERFDAALVESPEFVPALVGAARAWLNLALGWYRAPQAAADQAAIALRRALAIEPGHAEANALLGSIEHSFERNWPAAQRSFERAVQESPQMAFVHSAYGRHLCFRGAFDAAERHLLLARRLDPLYPTTRMHMVNLRIVQQRFADAEAEIDGMADIAPDSMPLTGLRGLVALVRGDLPAALQHYQRARELAPDYPGCIASVAAVLAAMGRSDEAQALMAPIEAADSLSPYVLAIVAARGGHNDQALARLQRAVDMCDPNVAMLPTDPSFASLHGDPRWRTLLASATTPRPPTPRGP